MPIKWIPYWKSWSGKLSFSERLQGTWVVGEMDVGSWQLRNGENWSECKVAVEATRSNTGGGKFVGVETRARVRLASRSSAFMKSSKKSG